MNLSFCMQIFDTWCIILCLFSLSQQNSKGMVVKKSDRKIKTVFSENFEIPDIAEYVTAMPCVLKQFTCQNVSCSRTIFKLKTRVLSFPSLLSSLLPCFPLFSFFLTVYCLLYRFFRTGGALKQTVLL